jgi:hypothetical protein
MHVKTPVAIGNAMFIHVDDACMTKFKMRIEIADHFAAVAASGKYY